MTESTPNARAEWLSRRQNACCTRGARDVTGADIVRISRTLALEPWHFTQAAPAAADDPLGVVLDGVRRRVTVNLANAAHGCVFLVRTGSGAGRCGLGDLAPVACRIFPTAPDARDPDVPPTSESQPAEHPYGHLEDAELAELLRVWAADRAHWLEVIRRWNAQADNTNTTSLRTPDFLRYLLEAQAARDVGTPWPEEVRA